MLKLLPPGHPTWLKGNPNSKLQALGACPACPTRGGQLSHPGVPWGVPVDGARGAEWVPCTDGDSDSSSAPLGRIRNPAAADAAELRRNPVVTQRHGPRVTLSVTQITDVKPARRRGRPGPRSPREAIQPLRLQTPSLPWERAAGSPSPRSGCPSGVTLVLENQSSVAVALHHFCPKTSGGFAVGTTERG